jgi:hypothetical protein
MNTALLADPPFASLFAYFSPPCMNQPSLFYLLGDPPFGDRGANIHPLSSLVSDQLFTPCFLTLPRDTPRFMLHVYIDDITTSATLLMQLNSMEFLGIAKRKVSWNSTYGIPNFRDSLQWYMSI